MDNGGGIDGGSNLAHKFAGLAVSSSNTNGSPNSNPNNTTTTNNNSNIDGLFQVMKAVEAAEATINQQAEENTRLRTELQKKIKELENYKSEYSIARRPRLVDYWDDRAQGPYRIHQLDSSLVNQGDGVRGTGGTFLNGPSGPIVPQDIMRNNVDPAIQTRAENRSESSNINGTLKASNGRRM